MKYHCTDQTDFDDLFGHEQPTPDGLNFAYGPIPRAMMNDEELVLENSNALSLLMVAKLKMMAGSLLLIETATLIQAGKHFQVIFA